MKTFVAILLVVCSGLVVIKAAPTEEQIQAFRKILKDCAEKENASPADVNDFLAHKPAIEPQAKCFRACLHESFGTMKGNKFSREGFMTTMQMKIDGDAGKMKTANEIADICANEGDSDRCEAGAKICKCLGDAFKAKGMDA